MPAITAETLARLRAFDTPTICNLIELFEVRPHNTGYMDQRIQAAFPEMPPMVGFAATATFRAAAPPHAGASYASLAEQVERFAELDGPAVVVFQDLDDPSAAATFGEVMCSTYQAFGAVGLIISGSGRDLDQVRVLGFPVFTNGTVCAHGYTYIPSVHVPVRVGGVTIHPNDLLHGDLNGVTTIPHEIAAEVAELGPAFVAAEQIVIQVVRSGSCSVAQFRAALGETQAQIAALRQQVTRRRS
ncbi:MAG: RraA family protein [Chloroflexota bacterium]